MYLGRGCGSDGRAVGFDVRDAWFESHHQKIFNFIEMDLSSIRTLCQR